MDGGHFRALPRKLVGFLEFVHGNSFGNKHARFPFLGRCWWGYQQRLKKYFTKNMRNRKIAHIFATN